MPRRVRRLDPIGSGSPLIQRVRSQVLRRLARSKVINGLRPLAVGLGTWAWRRKPEVGDPATPSLSTAKLPALAPYLLGLELDQGWQTCIDVCARHRADAFRE